MFMPWQEVSVVSSRKEFVLLASQPGANIRELCRRNGVSPTTAYKILARFGEEGEAGLLDRLRRPHVFPRQTLADVEEAVLEVRDRHPAWGGRKIRRRLLDLGHEQVPAASTITVILQRNGRLAGAAGCSSKRWQRFEQEAPNRLWQMDFKGHFALVLGRCHALTVLDDHSRFALGLEACGNQRGTTVQECLSHVFRSYGLPECMLMDNGSPWGSDFEHPHTPLTAWLIRLGVRVLHSRPYHPQTMGKDERFHRTLKAELLGGPPFRDLVHCQRRFDRWRDVYNLERPHEALGMATPASRYRSSPRPFPESLPAIEYGPGDSVRKVGEKGRIAFRGRVQSQQSLPRLSHSSKAHDRGWLLGCPLLQPASRPDRRQGRLKASTMCPNTCNLCVRSEHLRRGVGGDPRLRARTGWSRS